MTQWLNQLSKTTLAMLIMGAGILFIVLNDPPRTICNAQSDVFTKSQQGFVFRDPKDKSRKTSRFSEYQERCKSSNSPGGCYEYFHRLRQMMNDLDVVSPECRSFVAGQKPVKDAIWSSMELMVLMAWGSHPPPSFHEKFNWLDISDMNLFCKMKETSGRVLGADSYESFRERLLQAVPGAKELSRKEAWDKSILSVNCDQYR